MTHIILPPKFSVGEQFRKRLAACLDSGECLTWIIQSRDLRTKVLGEYTRADLSEAEDVVISFYQWFSFRDWQSPTIAEFIASNSDLSFGEWHSLSAEKESA